MISLLGYSTLFHNSLNLFFNLEYGFILFSYFGGIVLPIATTSEIKITNTRVPRNVNGLWVIAEKTAAIINTVRTRIF